MWQQHVVDEVVYALGCTREEAVSAVRQSNGDFCEALHVIQDPKPRATAPPGYPGHGHIRPGDLPPPRPLAPAPVPEVRVTREDRISELERLLAAEKMRTQRLLWMLHAELSK
jgi:hypothetical protein